MLIEGIFLEDVYRFSEMGIIDKINDSAWLIEIAESFLCDFY